MVESQGENVGLDSFEKGIVASTEALAKKMCLAGLTMMEKAIKETLSGQRHGRTYTVARSTAARGRPVQLLNGQILTRFERPPRVHVAAAEDEAPGVLTGRLRNSVSTTLPEVKGSTVEGKYGTNVEYAKIHEFGGTVENSKTGATVRIPARPYVRPSEDKTFPKIIRKWREMLK